MDVYEVESYVCGHRIFSKIWSRIAASAIAFLRVVCMAIGPGISTMSWLVLGPVFLETLQVKQFQQAEAINILSLT